MPHEPSPGLSRRELLKLAPLLLLGGFAVPSLRDGLLKSGVSFSDRAAGLLYRRGHLAPTFAAADAVPFASFPYNGYDILEPAIDFSTWSLKVAGAVTKPGAYTLDQIRSLPKVQQTTRHICVEGWDAIGRFGGARLSDFLAMVGADPQARFITVTCADDYYESLDMATARQPQSLLSYEMYEQPLDAGHGAPLRLQLPTKLGYKQAKYLMTLNVTSVLPAQSSYWGDQGYSWYGGLLDRYTSTRGHVRFVHWTNAVSIAVLTLSGLRIFVAFPSFGPRIPLHTLVDIPEALTIGGWLGGALQWHFTFMWIFASGAALYVISQLASGHYRTVMFTPHDIPRVWPMARHYFLFGPKPAQTEQYNPLQKLAYTSAIVFGALSLATGMVMFKPAQFSTLGLLFGGYHNARIVHFLAMCGLLSFIPGHLIMVALHGWDNFRSMLTGWKHHPEYTIGETK